MVAGCKTVIIVYHGYRLQDSYYRVLWLLGAQTDPLTTFPEVSPHHQQASRYDELSSSSQVSIEEVTDDDLSSTQPSSPQPYQYQGTTTVPSSSYSVASARTTTTTNHKDVSSSNHSSYTVQQPEEQVAYLLTLTCPATWPVINSKYTQNFLYSLFIIVKSL